MKKIRYVIAVLALTFCWACTDYTEDYPIPPASVVAKFTATSSNQFVPPDEVTFINQSIVPQNAGTPGYLWDFGDGNTSTVESPKHTFTTEGDFTVILSLTTSNGDEATAAETLKFKLTLQGDTLFSEDFEGITLIPEAWVLINVDGNVPDNPSYATMEDSAWVVRSSSTFGGNVALGNSYYNPEAGADDWMILPKLAVTENTMLSWDAMSLTVSGNYKDDYLVYVSTTTPDVEGCTANPFLYKVDQEEAGTDSGTPGLGIQNHEVSLADYGGQEIYIAFRLNTPSPGGDRLAIDNITVIDTK